VRIIIDIQLGKDGGQSGPVRPCSRTMVIERLGVLGRVDRLYQADVTTSRGEDNTRRSEQNVTDLIWSFSPWVAFLLGVRIGDVYWGAAAGIVVAAVVLARSVVRHRTHLFDVVGVVYFAGMLILLAALHPHDIGTWGRYAQAVAHGSLTVLVFGSVLINRPFTEPYAREQVPKEFWGSPEFRATNRRISLVWGLGFLVGTASLIAAGSTGDRQLLLRILVPFGALFLAYVYTQKQSAAAKADPEPDTVPGQR
jgi:hypothetical protein